MIYLTPLSTMAGLLDLSVGVLTNVPGIHAVPTERRALSEAAVRRCVSVLARTPRCVRLHESGSCSGKGRVVFPLAAQQQPTLRARQIVQDVVKVYALPRHLVLLLQGFDLSLELRFDPVCSPWLKHRLIHPTERALFSTRPASMVLPRPTSSHSRPRPRKRRSAVCAVFTW